jgi:pimeloyl-ACP methyl ester carboxylesterase
VLVLSGLVASDRSTRLLRDFLTRRGYEMHGKYGPRPSVAQAMLATVDRLHATSGRRVSPIGQSRGGAYARLLAVQRPDAVRCVITLRSPMSTRGSERLAYRNSDGPGSSRKPHPRAPGLDTRFQRAARKV